jgi:hypothetical protein
VLAGRLAGAVAEYAWLRPGVGPEDRQHSGLPLRSGWHSLAEGSTLREAVLQLRKIHAWHHLESPPAAGFPYELALRRASGGPLVSGPLAGGERYSLVLRAKPGFPLQAAEPRYVYAFLINSQGRSVLLFPISTAGSVEDHVPAKKPAPPEISLENSVFEVTEPYGIDTYFLLTSDEPLPDPWILEWEGVRVPDLTERTPLEQLVLLTNSRIRSANHVSTPASWSIERKVIESVPPPHP